MTKTPTIDGYFRLILKHAKRREGWAHSSIEDLVHGEGVRCVPSPLPAGVAKGRKRECFTNAFHLAHQHPRRYIYVEGYAVAHQIPLPLLHAWCVERRTGLVVDPTWADGVEYYGIPLKLGYVWKTLAAKGTYSVLDNQEQSWPLLRQGLVMRNKARMGRSTT